MNQNNLTIRQTIIGDTSLVELVKRFRGWPDRLAALKDQLADIDFENATDKTVDNIEDEIKTLEAELMFEIVNDETPLFNTSESVFSETETRLNKSKEFIKLLGEINVLRTLELQGKLSEDEKILLEQNNRRSEFIRLGVERMVKAESRKTFTNDEQRKSELKRRLSRNKDYVDLMNKLRGARRADAERKQRFAKVRNQLEWAKDSYFTDKAVIECVAGLCYESVAVTKIEKVISRAGEMSANVG